MRVFSEEHRKKLSEAKKKNPVKYWQGKGHLRKGENAPNYKGGFTPYETVKRWRMKNRDQVNFWNRVRFRKKVSSGGTHSLEEWNELKKSFDFTCVCCGLKEPDIFLTEDHIVPLSCGGSDDIDNIQPLCGSCNSRKSTSIIDFRENKNDCIL